MATTITAATLTVTLTEAISLNGQDKGATNTLTIPAVTEVSQRIVNVPTSEVAILAMGTAVASGQFVESDVRYIRITNKDDTNYVTLTFKNENDDEFAVKLDYGQSFIYNGDLSGGVVDTMDGIDGTGLSLSLGDLVNITALANTAACDLELFVAGV
tara:strand:+ start:1627 stop:2097 length:471 start_codon:yes stop_codon:yes gene_type:complete